MRYVALLVFVVWGACKNASETGSSGAGSGSGPGSGSGAAGAGASAGSGTGVAPPLPIKVPPFELPPPADKITSLSGDAEAVCVTRASGHVDCWGAWSDDPQGRVKRVPGVDDATAVAVTKYQLCILRRSGVSCSSDVHEALAAIALPRGVTVDQVVSPCARTTTGKLACWDNAGAKNAATLALRVNDIAQLGGACAVTAKGRMLCKLGNRWERVPKIEHVRRYAAGLQAGEAEQFQAGCAILDDDSVRCFTVSQIPGRPGLRVDLHKTKPETDRVLEGATALALDDHGLIALVGGKVLVVRDDEPIRMVSTVSDAVAITPRCALRAQGSVVCWGDRGGTLGQPHLAGSRSDTPVPVVGIADVVSVAHTKDMGWAVTRDGKLYQWGGRRTGWPTEVAFEGPAAEVVASPMGYGEEACVLRRDHRVSCRTAEVGFKDVGLADVAALRSDGNLVIARLANGTGVTWYGLKPAEHKPMANVEGAVEIASTAAPRCYRTATTVKCTPYDCVRDARGVCSYVDKPYVDIAVKDVVELAHGRNTLCARTQQRTVVCWGESAFVPGAGSGALVPPEPVAKIDDAVGLASDYENLCVVRADGRLTCWAAAKREAPHDVLPAGSVAPPIAGALEGCAIRPDGRAACWGSDEAGQLGAGTVIALETPAAVPGL